MKNWRDQIDFDNDYNTMYIWLDLRSLRYVVNEGV